MAVLLGVLLLAKGFSDDGGFLSTGSKSTTTTTTHHAAGSGATTTTAPIDPATVHVFVANGSGTTGAAAKASQVLAGKGYPTPGTGNAPTATTTTVFYTPGHAAQAAAGGQEPRPPGHRGGADAEPAAGQQPRGGHRPAWSSAPTARWPRSSTATRRPRRRPPPPPSPDRMSAAALPAALGPFVVEPLQSGVFVDFDGTLSEIVDDPGAATPLAGTADVLDGAGGAVRAGRRCCRGDRSTSWRRGSAPGSCCRASTASRRWSTDGASTTRSAACGGRSSTTSPLQSASRGPDGMRVEAKGLSLTLHYRGRPERRGEVRAWAEQQAARSGLEVRSARLSFELHPPIDVDKGSSLLELADDLDAVCFIGDDVGDLPAFDALDQLAAARGHHRAGRRAQRRGGRRAARPRRPRGRRARRRARACFRRCSPPPADRRASPPACGGRPARAAPRPPSARTSGDAASASASASAVPLTS